MLVLFALVILTIARAAAASDVVVADENDRLASTELPPGKVLIQWNDRLRLVDAYQPTTTSTSYAHTPSMTVKSLTRPVSATIRIWAANFDADADTDGWRVSTAILDRAGRPTEHAFTVKYELLITEQPALMRPAFNTGGAGHTTRGANRRVKPRVLQTWHKSSRYSGRDASDHLLKLNSSALAQIGSADKIPARNIRTESKLRPVTSGLPDRAYRFRVGAPATRLLIRARVSVPGSGVLVATEVVSVDPAIFF